MTAPVPGWESLKVSWGMLWFATSSFNWNQQLGNTAQPNKAAFIMLPLEGGILNITGGWRYSQMQVHRISKYSDWGSNLWWNWEHVWHLERLMLQSIGRSTGVKHQNNNWQQSSGSDHVWGAKTIVCLERQTCKTADTMWSGEFMCTCEYGLQPTPFLW